MTGEEPTYQPARMIAGHCPECARIVVVFNSHETWPIVRCDCGWQGATTAIDNHVRLERDGIVKLAPGVAWPDSLDPDTTRYRTLRSADLDELLEARPSSTDAELIDYLERHRRPT